MNRIGLVVALVICICVHTAHAQAGAGAQSCGFWTKVHEDKNDLAEGILRNWIQGYLWGAAQTMTLTLAQSTHLSIQDVQKMYAATYGLIFAPPDDDALIGWVSNYCKEH